MLNSEENRPTIHSPADAAAMLQHEMSALEQGHLRMILLDTRNRVIDIVEIYYGSLNSAQVRMAELFKPAIQRMAATIILVHNHPSGDPTPSPDDVAVTRAVVQAGKLLDIDTLDHMIIEDINPYYKDLLATLISFPQPFHQFVVYITFGTQQDGMVKALIVYAVNIENPLIGYSMLGPQY